MLDSQTPEEEKQEVDQSYPGLENPPSNIPKEKFSQRQATLKVSPPTRRTKSSPPHSAEKFAESCVCMKENN